MIGNVRTRTSWTWRMLLSVALLALAFRIAAPPGYMIDVAPRGLAITLCTAHGATVAYLDLPADADGSSPNPASEKRSAAPCTFAGAPTIAPPAQAAGLNLAGDLGFVVARDLPESHERVVARGHIRPPPTGPPLLA